MPGMINRVFNNNRREGHRIDKVSRLCIGIFDGMSNLGETDSVSTQRIIRMRLRPIKETGDIREGDVRRLFRKGASGGVGEGFVKIKNSEKGVVDGMILGDVGRIMTGRDGGSGVEEFTSKVTTTRKMNIDRGRGMNKSNIRLTTNRENLCEIEEEEIGIRDANSAGAKGRRMETELTVRMEIFVGEVSKYGIGTGRGGDRTDTCNHSAKAMMNSDTVLIILSGEVNKLCTIF